MKICVFCGSSPGVRECYGNAARGLGALLARAGHSVVYGGGRVGLMGLVAQGALEAGGEVIGVIPDDLVRKEVAMTSLCDLRVVGSMHERKSLMSDLSDAFIALPGGFGTFEEFFEVLTWAQLGYHRKPCGLLNVDGYYDTLIQFLQQSHAEGFVRKESLEMVLHDADPLRLLEKFEKYHPPLVPKWLQKKSDL